MQFVGKILEDVDWLACIFPRLLRPAAALDVSSMEKNGYRIKRLNLADEREDASSPSPSLASLASLVILGWSRVHYIALASTQAREQGRKRVHVRESTKRSRLTKCVRLRSIIHISKGQGEGVSCRGLTRGNA